jgi:anti-sigma factor RsiW
MKHDPADNPMRDLLWRRKLTEAQRTELRAWLESHPDERNGLEEDERLTSLLGRLPDAPVASNFTARAMQAVEHEAESEQRGRVVHRQGWWWRSLLPRMAVVVVLVFGVFFIHQRYQDARAAELVRSLVAVTQVESLPDPAFLQNFDAIRRLSKPPPVDEELIELLQ